MDVQLRKASTVIKNASALLITAGAGMGVDSGLPDFRGPEGFWKAYPPIKDRGLTLPEMSTPSWFVDDPQFAWGFFGHRLNLYRNTQPHEGFQILRKWASQMKNGHFVYTSNVDGHFQKSGFDEENVLECHGSINYMQTLDGSAEIWPTPEALNLNVNEKNLKAKLPLPTGPPSLPPCDQVLARPNILMFNDFYWVPNRTEAQELRFKKWFSHVRNEKVVVIEIGAGLYVPTIRNTSEICARNSTNNDSCLIRINPNEAKVPFSTDISLPLKALEALKLIDKLMH